MLWHDTPNPGTTTLSKKIHQNSKKEEKLFFFFLARPKNEMKRLKSGREAGETYTRQSQKVF